MSWCSSPKVWRRYISEVQMKYNGKLKKVNFRNKISGWKTFSLTFQFDNGRTYEQVFNRDSYMKLFLQNFCLRPSCHDCKFKDMNRPSDITIGDCWGIEKYMPQMDDNKGTSAVFVHTQKGQKLIDNVMEELQIVRSEVDLVLPPTADSRISVRQPSKRNQFFASFNKGYSINRLINIFANLFFAKIKRKCKSLLKKVRERK